jgi:hypothetical protein
VLGGVAFLGCVGGWECDCTIVDNVYNDVDGVEGLREDCGKETCGD